MEKMGMIGSGNIGTTLGTRFSQRGHQVFFGAREADKAAKIAQSAGNGARGGTLDEAAGFVDPLQWTVRESDPPLVLGSPALLEGEIIMDLNNRDYAHDVQQGAWFAESSAERLQKNVPTSKVVKVFNTLAMEAFNTSALLSKASGAQTFLAGADPDAKRRVAALAEALGGVIRLILIPQQRGASAHLKVTTLPPTDLGTIGGREASRYD